MAREDNPRCALCDGPHPFDTVVPSVVWNEVVRANELPDYLCTTCIIEQFAKRGVSFNCELWGAEFNGTPISVHVNGRWARDSQRLSAANTDLRYMLRQAEAARDQALAELAEWRIGTRALVTTIGYTPLTQGTAGPGYTVCEHCHRGVLLNMVCGCRYTTTVSDPPAVPQPQESRCGASPNTPDVADGHHCTRRAGHEGPHRVCADGELYAEWF